MAFVPATCCSRPHHHGLVPHRAGRRRLLRGEGRPGWGRGGVRGGTGRWRWSGEVLRATNFGVHGNEDSREPLLSDAVGFTSPSGQNSNGATTSANGGAGGYSSGPSNLGQKTAATARVVYEVLRVSSSGEDTSTVLARREIMRGLGVAPRDLRRIDPSLALTTTPPALVVRDRVLLLNVGGVRAIVTKNEAFLFEPWRNSAAQFRENLKERLETKKSEAAALGNEEEGEYADLLDVDRPTPRAAAYSSRVSADGEKTQTSMLPGSSVYVNVEGNFIVPFELDVVESALIVATQKLDEMMNESSRRLSDLMSSMPTQNKVTADKLEELRRVKQVLLQLDTQAGALRHMLLDTLDDEDDVKGMVLDMRHAKRTVKATDGSDEALSEVENFAEEEVENLLEYYLQRAEACHSESERLLSGARDLEESLSVSLSSRRYEVTRMELTLSIASFATSLGAMIAGIFGMNLQSRLELSVTAFYGTTGGIVVGAILIFIFTYRLMKKKLIL